MLRYCANLLVMLSATANVSHHKHSVFMIYLVGSFMKLFDFYYAGVD